MFCFEILVIFRGKSQKRRTRKIWAKRAPKPQRRLAPQCGMPRHSEAEVPKKAPLGYATA